MILFEGARKFAIVFLALMATLTLASLASLEPMRNGSLMNSSLYMIMKSVLKNALSVAAACKMMQAVTRVSGSCSFFSIC